MNLIDFYYCNNGLLTITGKYGGYNNGYDPKNTCNVIYVNTIETMIPHKKLHQATCNLLINCSCTLYNDIQ